MKNLTVLATAGLIIVALGGCSPTTEKASTETAPAAPTVWTGSPAPAHSGGHGGGGAKPGEAADEPRAEGANLHRYIVDNKIAEVPFKADEPGTPDIEFPLPPDWSPAGDKTPDWAYGAIIYSKAKDPDNPPFLYAIASKLTGNVDAGKVLELAPGQLNELPDFKPFDGPPERSQLSGFDAVSYVGTYVWEGKPRAVGQQTIVIPGKDGLFVLQLNGEAPKGQEQVVVDAVKVIREQTKIALPS
ncbi:MAG: hypothetical protein FGM52_08915 [Mycobacterium sp.]|nr:hypothetical protein [Mycobacterium sp.]